MEIGNRKNIEYTAVFYVEFKGLKTHPIRAIHYTTPRYRSSLSMWYNITPMSLFRIIGAYYRPLFLIRSENGFNIEKRLFSFCESLDISVCRDQDKIRESLIKFFNKDFSDIPMFKLWQL